MLTSLVSSSSNRADEGPPRPRVEVRNIRKEYGRGDQVVASLKGVSLALAPGEMVVIMGPSGCGKSSLLNVIGLIDQPSSGSVLIDGENVSGLSDNARSHHRCRSIGFVFQFFNLLPSLTVLQNVLIPSELAGLPRKPAHERACELLDRVGLAHRSHHLPDELSGGEMQRVSIARALVNEPKVLLCDEPTGSLDSATGRQIMDLIRSIPGPSGRSVLMVTHDPRGGDFADRLLTMGDGLVESEVDRRGCHDSTVHAA